MMMRSAAGACIAGSVLAALVAASADGNASCTCPYTSGNRNSCCSSGANAGEGTGDFCGNWFEQQHCGGDTPVCCNSDGASRCCKAGATCTRQCGFGMTGCDCIDPPEESPASRAFDVRMAKAFASLAQASNCAPGEPLRSWSCAACREVGFDVKPDSMHFITRNGLGDNTSFAFVTALETVDPKEHLGCAVSFRGTKNAMNVLQDISAVFRSMESCDGCQVHGGFYGVYLSMELELLEALTERNCKPEAGGGDIYITGHSMGGSISQLAMYALKARGFQVVQSVNFESPRVGNPTFVSAFEKGFGRDVAAFRIANKMDPVVHLPPPGLDYAHTGPEVYYYPDYNQDSFIICPTGEDPACERRYTLIECTVHGNEHCESALAEGGNICSCPIPEAVVVV